MPFGNGLLPAVKRYLSIKMLLPLTTGLLTVGVGWELCRPGKGSFAEP